MFLTKELLRVGLRVQFQDYEKVHTGTVVQIHVPTYDFYIKWDTAYFSKYCTIGISNKWSVIENELDSEIESPCDVCGKMNTSGVSVCWNFHNHP